MVLRDILFGIFPQLIQRGTVQHGHVDVVVPWIHPAVALGADGRSTVRRPPRDVQVLRQSIPPGQCVVQANLFPEQVFFRRDVVDPEAQLVLGRFGCIVGNNVDRVHYRRRDVLGQFTTFHREIRMQIVAVKPF